MVLRARGMLLAAILVLVAACGGSGSAGDPAGSVQAALSAVNGQPISAMADYTCAAQKANLTSGFGANAVATLQQAGISLSDLLAALTLGVSNVSTKEVSRSDTTATVHVTADLAVSFDKPKMRAILLQVLVAQGQVVDNAMLDQAMDAMSAQMSKPQHIDRDVEMTNEGGKWLICSGALTGGS
jgi:hypothetical protein